MTKMTTDENDQSDKMTNDENDQNDKMTNEWPKCQNDQWRNDQNDQPTIDENDQNGQNDQWFSSKRSRRVNNGESKNH